MDLLILDFQQILKCLEDLAVQLVQEIQATRLNLKHLNFLQSQGSQRVLDHLACLWVPKVPIARVDRSVPVVLLVQ